MFLDKIFKKPLRIEAVFLYLFVSKTYFDGALFRWVIPSLTYAALAGLARILSQRIYYLHLFR